MRPTAQIHEVSAMRFWEVNERFHRHELTCEQAAEVMGVSVSTFYRKRQRFAEEGAGGLVDRRIGKISARRVPVDEAMRVIALFETKYYDFTVKHFHEKLVSKDTSAVIPC
jgi:transposase